MPVCQRAGDGADAETSHRLQRLAKACTDCSLGVGRHLGRNDIDRVEHGLGDVSCHDGIRHAGAGNQTSMGILHAHRRGAEHAAHDNRYAGGAHDRLGGDARDAESQQECRLGAIEHRRAAARSLRPRDLHESAAQHHANDERRKRHQLHEYALPETRNVRTDQHEVASHMRSEQSEQGDEAERIHIACNRREQVIFRFHRRYPVTDAAQGEFTRHASVNGPPNESRRYSRREIARALLRACPM